ncbi:MAG: benzodiazapine receptor [Cryomorphaceae bacterium]|jgi:benzodiazapine receptor
MINNETLNSSALPLYLLACIAAMAFGGLFSPGEWYTSLNRAPWSPPDIAFPIVWSILYVLIGFAGWLIGRSKSKFLLKLWLWQLVLNALWSWLFFGLQWFTVALVDLLIITALVGLLIYRCLQQRQKTAASMLIPYLIWLIVATSLNVYVVAMN